MNHSTLVRMIECGAHATEIPITMHPRTRGYSKMNYAKYIRDIMVANGDAAKSIWISEMNSNAVPNDPRSPFITSGLRVGTPAITTRGFGEAECRELAGWMCDVIDGRGDAAVIEAAKASVLAICAKHPVYER